MNNFEQLRTYLLSGSENDEGLTLQEEYDALMIEISKFDYLSRFDVYRNFPQLLTMPKSGNWKPDPHHPLFPPTTGTPFIDARSNTAAGGLTLPKWKP